MNDTCNADNTMVPDAAIAPFGMSLFGTLAAAATGSSGNILLSPLSVAMALGLVLAGTTQSSLCESQLLKVLGVSSHESLPRLASSILPSSKGVDLNIATSIWTSQIKPSFVSLAQDTHSAGAKELPKTYAPIDEWITEKTHGLISNMLQGDIDPLVRAVLVNAVHFKGSWANKFQDHLTLDGAFTAANGLQHEARYMCAERKMLVGKNLPKHGGATAIRLDYEGNNGDYCSLFVLPKDASEDSMQAAIAGLQQEPLSTTLTRLRSETVDLRLPRFKVEWGVKSLKPALQQMGLSEVFDGKDVLQNMSDDPDLHLDTILHKAVMEVTEEGTVAAAATVGIVATRSLSPEPLHVKFDRPFLVVVLHVPTATPLFVGRLNEPQLKF